MQDIPFPFRPYGEGFDIKPFHNLMKKLRHPEDGCPWDKEQTLPAMAKPLTDEAREAAEALAGQDYEHMCEELGDVVLNVMLATVIAEEQGRFTWRDVMNRVTRKLITRHPHVFGDEKAETTEDALRIFNGAKQKEKQQEQTHTATAAVPPMPPPPPPPPPAPASTPSPAPVASAAPSTSSVPSVTPPPPPQSAAKTPIQQTSSKGDAPMEPFIEGWPNFCGEEARVEEVMSRKGPFYLQDSGIDFNSIQAAWGIALHMQQPLIPAGGSDLRSAEIISNLKFMMDNQGIGDNHNAPVFHWCYKRIGELVPELVGQGKNPRVMLDYAGCLFHGLPQMGLWDVIDTLRGVTTNSQYQRNVEWLACTWGHAVAPSTPVQDYRLQVKAWQHHFAALFGWDALARVRGFSPTEMALPNHPDIAYEYIKTLKDCGLLWVLIQEHSVELPANGNSPEHPYIPHRLVAKNTKGEEISIIALIKTQGSDTKLVAQMQPLYEARSKQHENLDGKSIPPYIVQIGDGENGGVMMNEFPGMFRQAMSEATGSNTPAMNGTEYIEHLFNMGISESDLPVCQPKWTKLLFEHYKPGDDLDKAIEECKKADGRFNMEGGSWTNDISWVHGYENVLGPMEKASVLFAEKTKNIPTSDIRYRKALFHLLCSQTSCYRYWGQGLFTDYGEEICRRTIDILNYDL